MFLIHGCTLLILLRCRSPAFVVRAVLVTFKNEFSAQGNSWTGEELLPFPHGPRPRGPTVWPFHFGPQILVMHYDVVEDHSFCHCGTETSLCMADTDDTLCTCLYHRSPIQTYVARRKILHLVCSWGKGKPGSIGELLLMPPTHPILRRS